MKKIKRSLVTFISTILLLTLIACDVSINDIVGDNTNSSNVTINSVADLKNTENFRKGALEHILEGEVNRSGKAVGFHYEGMPTAKGEVIEGTRSEPNDEGVYTAKVTVDGIAKTSNGGKSSFFPEDLSPQEVVDKINEAYNDRVFVKGSDNTYRGETEDGLEIEMYIDNNDKIISAFPIY